MMNLKFREKGKEGHTKLVDKDSVPSDAEAAQMPNMPAMRWTSAKRMDAMLDAAVHGLEGQNKELTGCVKATKPIIMFAVRLIMYVAPLYAWLYKWCYYLYAISPKSIIEMVVGICLCFFGGTYVASISAIEAFRQMGWHTTYQNIMLIKQDFDDVAEASSKDDDVDANDDGIKDVDQMAAQELFHHKIALAMTTVKQPDRLQAAVGGLWAAYLAVLATLKLEFARTTALALGLVEMAKVPVTRLVAEPLSMLLGDNLKHWAKTIIESSLSIIAIIFAWYLQMIISAFYSGIRGGRMFADGLVKFLEEKDLMKHVPLVKKPFDPNESFVDDVLGYSIGLLGFAFQIFNGFRLFFPLDLVLLPLTIVEWILRWQITMGPSV